MSTKIRLRRMGQKKSPFYRIVVADSRCARDGRFIEELGYFNPSGKSEELKLDEEKALKWLQSGAKPSETVKTLFKKNGVWHQFNQK